MNNEGQFIEELALGLIARTDPLAARIVDVVLGEDSGHDSQNGEHPVDCSYCAKVAAVAEILRQLKELELKYRSHLWMAHGHNGKYGDDGEMQCAECIKTHGFYDWKREPLERIEKAYFLERARLVAAPPERKGE